MESRSAIQAKAEHVAGPVYLNTADDQNHRDPVRVEKWGLSLAVNFQTKIN